MKIISLFSVFVGVGIFSSSAFAGSSHVCRVADVAAVQEFGAVFTTNFNVSLEDCQPGLSILGHKIGVIAPAASAITLHELMVSRRAAEFELVDRGYGADLLAIDGRTLPALDVNESRHRQAIVIDDAGTAIAAQVAAILDQAQTPLKSYTTYSKDKTKSVTSTRREIRLRLPESGLEIRVEEFGRNYSHYIGLNEGHSLLGFTYKASKRGERTLTLSPTESAYVINALKLRPEQIVQAMTPPSESFLQGFKLQRNKINLIVLQIL